MRLLRPFLILATAEDCPNCPPALRIFSQCSDIYVDETPLFHLRHLPFSRRSEISFLTGTAFEQRFPGAPDLSDYIKWTPCFLLVSELAWYTKTVTDNDVSLFNGDIRYYGSTLTEGAGSRFIHYSQDFSNSFQGLEEWISENFSSRPSLFFHPRGHLLEKLEEYFRSRK